MASVPGSAPRRGVVAPFLGSASKRHRLTKRLDASELQRCSPPRSGLCTATTWTSTCPPPGRNTSSCEVPSYVSSSLTATSATQPRRTHIRPRSFAGCAGSWAEHKHSSTGWANAAIGFVWSVWLARVKPRRRMFSIQITKRASAEAAVAHKLKKSLSSSFNIP